MARNTPRPELAQARQQGLHNIGEAAAATGLTTLFTSEPESSARWVNGCAVIGRYTIRQGDSGAYAARLVGRRPQARVVQWGRWNAKKLAKAVGGTAYLRLRERLLGR